MNCARFGEEAHMGNNADVSTRESTRLHLPWDVWLPHAIMKPKREDHHARKDTTGNGMAKHQNNDGAPQAKHCYCYCHHVRRQMEILFDQSAARLHHTLAAAQPVTQVMDCARFDEEAHMGNNTDELTRESTQLHLPCGMCGYPMPPFIKREKFIMRRRKIQNRR